MVTPKVERVRINRSGALLRYTPETVPSTMPTAEATTMESEASSAVRGSVRAMIALTGSLVPVNECPKSPWAA